jgi:Na+/proline symporter
MSGVTYISVPGTVLTDNFSYLQTTLGFFVGYLIIAFVLVPLYYRLGVVSLYEYLDHRFGVTSYRTGAWLFLVSKTLSASLRAYVVCVVLQSLLFDRYDIPFALNAALMMLLVWLYTRRGGVKSVVWVEMLKSVIMVGSIIVAIVFIINALGFGVVDAGQAIAESDLSRVFFFDDAMDSRYFWKQFLAGIFLVVAMTGMDQDMMQTILSCRTKRDAQRGLVASILVQMVVIALFLILGALLYLYVGDSGEAPHGDRLFGYVATQSGMPLVVGILFILGLIASTYSSAGSALTALTTSFTLDILGGGKRSDEELGRLRRKAHSAIAVTMALLIVAFNEWSSAGVITLIFTMASYTYGPLLGMFLFGLTTSRKVRDGITPFIAILSPVVCYIIASHSEVWFGGYIFSYEVIILNGAISYLLLWLFSRKG